MAQRAIKSPPQAENFSMENCTIILEETLNSWWKQSTKHYLPYKHDPDNISGQL